MRCERKRRFDVENDCGFLKVKWSQFTGVVDKFIVFYYNEQLKIRDMKWRHNQKAGLENANHENTGQLQRRKIWKSCYGKPKIEKNS